MSNDSTANATNDSSASVLPRFHRSTLSNNPPASPNHYSSTSLLPRLYGSTMPNSSTNDSAANVSSTTNYLRSKMLSRLY